MRVGIIQSNEGLNRTKMWRKGKIAISDSHLFLPLNICASGFGAFGLKLRLKPLESPPLIGSYSEMEVHHQHTWASSL